MEWVGLGVREVGFSDYIIYTDESGDSNPASVDPDYPVFVLNFCVFSKDDYAASVLLAVAAFKFAHFGHDMEVLHENEIRLQKSPFAFLRDNEQQQTLTRTNPTEHGIRSNQNSCDPRKAMWMNGGCRSCRNKEKPRK